VTDGRPRIAFTLCATWRKRIWTLSAHYGGRGRKYSCQRLRAGSSSFSWRMPARSSPIQAT